jgi:hypothetical protein
MRQATKWLVLGAMCLVTGGAARAQEMPQPGPEHERLKKDVGVWDATIKNWGAPDTEAMEWTGVETNTLQPGGFWIISSFKGDFAGTEFCGNGATGFDPVKKKYVGTWVDSMTPVLMTTEGTFNPSTQELTMTGEMFDPGSGKPARMRSVTKHNADGTRGMTMYMKPEGGDEYKMMEVAYKKRPAAASTR